MKAPFRGLNLLRTFGMGLAIQALLSRQTMWALPKSKLK